MRLTPDKVNFLIKYRSKLFLRSFLIDALTKAQSYPVLYCSDEELPTTENHSTILDSSNWHDSSIKWVSLTEDQQVTTIPESRNLFVLFNMIRNFNLMSDEQKQQADEIAKAEVGLTNLDYFHQQFEELPKTWAQPIDDKSEYFQYRNSWLGDIVMLLSPNKGSMLCYLDQVTIGRERQVNLHLNYLDTGVNRIFGETDTFDIKKGIPQNFKEASATTTVGRFLLNYCILSRAFNGKIPYVNSKWDLGVIEKQISAKMLSEEITVQEFKTFEDHLFFYGHFTELCVPSFSRKSLGTDPNVGKVKAELLEKYKGRLNDPLVIKEIEDTLINMDKAYLKDDSSLRFYGPLGGKSFGLHRKKMYLTVGGIESFSKGTGTYTFIGNSLSQGWDKTAFPAICNEIRKGSYDRGHETQLGGAQTKFIVRVFQDTIINQDDCGTTRGIEVDFKKIKVDDFIGHYVLPDNVPITNDNKQLYDGKKVKVRSALTCENKTGFCFHCVGDVFRKLDARMTNMLAVDVSSTFTTMALKNMHGTKLELMEIENLDDFVIN